MVWLGSKNEIGSVATPLPLRATGAPRLVVPFLNCTLPVGVAVDGAVAVTVAVIVTGEPNEDGLGEALTVVVVSAWPTAWPPAREPLLPTKLVSAGPYVADTECGEPGIDRLDVEPDVAAAQWLASSPLRPTGEPRFEASTANCTVPEGAVLPVEGQTLAVKVTAWPDTEGLAED